MFGVPGASIHGIDLHRIKAANPTAASEIERIGHSLLNGSESEQDFLKLCRLLDENGEKEKAEALLRSNADEGDKAHELYLELFGRSTENRFFNAIRAFELQFGVHLTNCQNSKYLATVCQSNPQGIMSQPLAQLEMLSRSGCEVYFVCESPNRIVCDVSSLESSNDRDLGVAPLALPLTWDGNAWQLEATST